MSNSIMMNISKPISSPCPANGRQTVGDGAFSTDATPSVLAVCHVQGNDNMYYYSTTFSGGPGVRFSGGFDVPKSKCPPDRGSSDCVRDSPASIAKSAYSTLLRATSASPASPSYFSSRPAAPASGPTAQKPLYFPLAESLPQSAVSPQPIPKSAVAAYAHELATPPLTPDDDDDDDSSESGSDLGQTSDDALELLAALFPRDAVNALPHAKRVSISSPGIGASFDGVVLTLPGKPRTLYVDGKSAEIVSLRESIVALLDLADEHLECNALVIALEKTTPALGDLLHSLMYVGGTVVTKPPFQVDSAYILVGLEI
ncbi:hypothetical protein HETIRDRAFT_452016 [Heterobasidion irregulare TC 32-1]|uniref:Ornithine decarboxylase antizyme n=1 Tax=Heterobasidion irregulare (strain TC 32-1) TaxID=747525 RepID=W4K3N1_HETIT|nr:uncharacterized protein HETIRDRAFT_452016 [Heterobasidion irregulare TC 32-1]ETW80417.1 hypothetical protein HETIRDRAFT_452016 [Heterobasidion irregulare TC 32-1]